MRDVVLRHVLPLFVGMLVAAFAIGRLDPAGRPRLRRTLGLFFAYVCSVAGEGLFTALGWHTRADELHWLSAVLESLTTIDIANTLFFRVALPLIKVPLPVIVSDVAVGFAYFLATLHGLHRAGVNLSGLVATSAIVSGVLGLSLAPTIGNILGGIALQLDESIREGDWIQLDANTQGRVKSIRWRHTLVETRNWDTIVVPNATLLSGNIFILGKRSGQPVQRRMWVYFDIDFRFSPGEVIRVVDEALRASPIPNVADDPPPNTVCMDFARDHHASLVTYGARFWLTDLAADDPTASRVRERVHAALKRANIPLAVPAQTVFLDKHDPAHVERREARSHIEKMALLARLELFRGFSHAELSHLARSLTPAPYARGEHVTEQDREAHWLYILADGEAEVLVRRSDGTQRPVRVLVGPDYFGEAACMTGARRSATVRAMTDCRCYKLDKEAFQRLIQERREIANEVSRVIAQRQTELARVRDGTNSLHPAQADDNEVSKVLAQVLRFFGV